MNRTKASMWSRLRSLTEWRLAMHRVTPHQLAMVEALERRPDYTETVLKAGMIEGHLFSMVFVENPRGQVAACVVFDDGLHRWTDWDYPEERG